MEIKIRGEQPADYNCIANVNYEAFINWMPDRIYSAEPLMVDVLRHNAKFDSELSLVAVIDDKIVGHALFSPFHFMVMGDQESAVVLAPIAVHPEFQSFGIGKMLIEEGHRIAQQKGYSFSLLCGHPNYYPKFGYKTQGYALSGVKIKIDKPDFSDEAFSERHVKANDISMIIEVWKNMHKDDTLSLFPGTTLSEWANHSPLARCSVILKNNDIIGFVRYAPSKVLRISELVAKKEDIADILAFLASKHYGNAQGEISITLPIEKIENALKPSECFEVKDERIAYDAFMIKVLNEGSSIVKYFDLLDKGEIKHGVIVFPPMFDIEHS